MKLNRKWFLVIALVLSLTMATGGTLAYLTDRDSEANVFVMGNVEIDLKESFEQGATLIPGVDIEKKPVITNTGKNDAWVWMEVAIPSALDNWDLETQEGSNKNVIHWNQLGATTDGYVTDARVSKAFAEGILTADMFPAGTTNYVDCITSNKMTWNIGGKAEFSKQKEIEVSGKKVNYNSYIIGYNKPLTPGETTLPNFFKVALDARVDINPDGKMYFVESGNVTDLNWDVDSDANGNPVIFVSAYAIQKEKFATVDEAISAYNGQWGDKGSEYGDVAPFAKVTTLDKNTTLTNKAGDVTVLDKNNMIDTTESKMGIDLGIIPLDVAYQFEPTMTDVEGAASEYADWHADFVVSTNNDIPAYGIGLAGYYDAWCSLNNNKWVMLAVDEVVPANTEIRLVDAMGNGSITVSYEELCNYGNDGIGFLCGAVDLSGQTVYGEKVEQIPPNTTITVELRLYEATGGSRDTETKKYITTGTYSYTFN